MNRSRNQVDAYYNRNISLHKPGVIPKSSRLISPITSNNHIYELKQRLYANKTVESWFANHSPQERRIVYSFLDTLYKDNRTNENKEQTQKPSNPRLSQRINTATSHSSQRRLSQSSHRNNRTSKDDLGEVLQSLESYRPSTSVQEKNDQTSSTISTIPIPDVNETKSSEINSKRPSTSIVKYPETIQPENSSNNKTSQRYLSQTWRVINPREDIELNVRPDSNTSSFFKYTKKTYPEYFFIHPDWY
ncbi:unnamed protein product [Rotaria sp. Silwood1]|nr:unnamed protein product [Rotaria sp. Silwood1]CAF1521694.1 unnamed protein product [Rotaria sp. Silwood1]CAF3699642.1 unnamed protein product [Rotaria sp. Silwood1]CAF3711915.1 unnamed protein product [Rotaria sp. Silwood1]CAF4716484.1 unnamed protein product [Rotaria sp. Silwood1]